MNISFEKYMCVYIETSTPVELVNSIKMKTYIELKFLFYWLSLYFFVLCGLFSYTAYEYLCHQLCSQEANNSLSLSMTTILPQEFLPHKSQWKLEGEYEVQKALATLMNSDHKPLGSVIVTSSASHPVLHFSPLLNKLAECGVDIKLHLWDSFWSRDLPSNDRDRLKPFLSKFKG
jgi:hypothetical protein